ncbi:MAG: TIGR01458 family HAD-type hydrolase [Alphaproteobacteria bacterium]|nr:TIGR01458 family HAD-type hydrolase [Alphaproteobacteria bacterium]
MTVRGVLLDLEGVLYEGDAVVAGAIDVARGLAASGYILRYLTNTTTRPRQAIAMRLAGMGLVVDSRHLFTPAIAAHAYLSAHDLRRLYLACPPSLGEDFAGFEFDDEHPQAVILGDLYKGFTWDLLNRAYGFLEAGARLIALHKNRYTRRDGEGLSLDLGPFVAALEYASGQDATVVGKPSKTFFEMALRELNLGVDEAVMVGDDLESDIGGAKHAGLRAIQVRTGKFTDGDEKRTDIRPDYRIDSIRDLPGLLDDFAVAGTRIR